MVTYTPTSDDVRLYEVAVLYPYPMNQKEESEVLKGVDAIFAEAGAKEIFKDAWGRRGLAYSIGGFKEGSFVIYYLEILPAKVKEMDGALRILKGVLRHLIMKPPKRYEIRSWANNEEQWKEKHRLEGERRAAEKEERLKKQVVDKAKRRPVAEKRKEEVPEEKKRAPTESISEQLDKLISDKDLDI